MSKIYKNATETNSIYLLKYQYGDFGQNIFNKTCRTFRNLCIDKYVLCIAQIICYIRWKFCGVTILTGTKSFVFKKYYHASHMVQYWLKLIYLDLPKLWFNVYPCWNSFLETLYIFILLAKIAPIQEHATGNYPKIIDGLHYLLFFTAT